MSAPGADANAAWRSLVFPANYRNPVPSGRYNLVVIGAGPAGLITSIAAAGLGARVALIERHAMGGDCLNVGCIPSKSLLAAAARGSSFEQAMAHVYAVRARIAEHDSVERYTAAGVDVYLGAAQFVDAHRIRVGEAELATRKTVICTGARAFVPPIPGLDALEVRTNETIFDLQRLPPRLAVLGGGPIGCELAQAFARLGSAVQLIEMQPRLLPLEDDAAASAVAASLQRDGVGLRLGARVSGAARAGDARVLILESGERIEVDEVLVAVGRQRNLESLGLDAAGIRFDPRAGIIVDRNLRTSQRDVFAAGDVCSRLQFTHHADAQARIVIRNALFAGRARADRLVVPWCTYTKPEVAHVGASRRELEQTGTAFRAFRVQFAELDRGRTDADDDGFAEVLTASGSDRILGATIVGKDAGEQIAPIALMMTTGLGLGSLATLLLPYPTRSEYLRRIADAWNRTRLTPRSARLLGWWLRRARGSR